MFKLIMSFCLASLLACPVDAQGVKRTEIHLSTGAAFPTSDFNLKYNYGFNGSVGLGFRMASGVRLVTKVEAQTFSIDPSLSVDSVTGGNYTALMTGVDLRFLKDVPKWGFDPVLLIGGGLAYSVVSALTVGSEYFDSRNETKFYLNVGAGVDIALTPRVSGFVTGRYVRISAGGTETEFFPIVFGIRF